MDRLPPAAAPRTGRLVCRVCSALPSGDGAFGANRCPWCRGPVSTEYGSIVAHCVECGVTGIVGEGLLTRDYPKGPLMVARAVCPAHAGDGGPA